MYAISSLLFLVALSLLVTRVATVILVATGVSRQTARFQARSAFTGAGFTTTESEEIVRHPLRRRVVMNLMLLGHAGLVAGAGSLILGFRSAGAGHNVYRVLLLVAGLAGLLLVSRSSWVDRRLTRLISHVLRRYTDVPVRDVAGLLDLSGSFSVGELAVAESDWVAGRTLGELGLRDEGVVVLGITRQDQAYRGAPVGSTMVHAGDVLVLYGTADALAELDRRPAGPAGDRRHEQAVALQEELIRRESSADQATDRADGDGKGGPRSGRPRRALRPGRRERAAR